MTLFKLVRTACQSLVTTSAAIVYMQAGQCQEHCPACTCHPKVLLPIRSCSPLCAQYGAEVFDVAKAQLWFAGKELLPGKKLGDYLGRNERTRAVIKLQNRGQGAPSREPVRERQPLPGRACPLGTLCCVCCQAHVGSR